MDKLVVPGHIGELRYIIPAIQVYAEDGDWVTTSDYIEREFDILKKNKVESEMKKDKTDYTKDAELPRYFGFLERQEPFNTKSPCRITSLGQKFYKAYINKDKIEIWKSLMEALETNTFGRLNEGCPSSNCDIEAPNILLISSFLLDGVSRKEFAAILDDMLYYNTEIANALFSIKIMRTQQQQPSNMVRVRADNKIIPFLTTLGFLEDVSGLLRLSEEVKKLFAHRIAKLPTRNKINQVSSNNIQEKIKTIPVEDISQEYHKFLTAMRTKPFLLLAGISGTGKSRIVKQMAFESCPKIEQLRNDMTAPGNYELIEVKPNWHDSTELLGYESEIGGQHYVLTPFVRFLVKAMRFQGDAPFFVCMDEMNLAPVEQYFAEFLSVLESRQLKEGVITSEPLIKAEIFAKYENTLKDELFGIKRNEPKNYGSATEDKNVEYGDFNNVYEELKKNGLRLPSNLIVIGTVNMDETTHQFSRKVIDRAMTIEMNIEDGEQPFNDFFNEKTSLEYKDPPIDKSLFLPKVVQASEALLILSEDDANYLKKNVPQRLNNLNLKLNNTPFKVAYRVQNELILYFYSLREEKQEGSAEDLLKLAFDAILMMKVLPRIEGDEDLLKEPLKELEEFTQYYPESHKKIEEMIARLDRVHFTSFWP